MADETTNGAAPAQQQAATFSIEKLYVKDVSFEVPGAPQVFNEQGQPELQMNLGQRVQRISDTAFEVVLGITLTCKVNDKTAYLAEVQQAGVFTLAGFEDAGVDAMLGTQCPTVLYPYAANIVTQLIQFDALYAETLRQRAAQADAGGGDLAGAETAGNA